MRLLFVHEVNWRRKVVYEIHDFPELLSLRGHEVVFIDFPEGEPRRGLRRVLDLKTEVFPAQSRAHVGSTVEIRTPGRVLAPPLDRIAASITQVPEVWRSLRDGGFDAVVLYGVPTNGWQTVRIARRHGVPVVFRAIDLSHALRRTPYRWLIRLAERSILKRAEWVSANNEALMRHCMERGADPIRISVDYPGLDLERFSPGPKPLRLLDRYQVGPDVRVVLFMGTFFRFAGLDWFIEQFAETLRRSTDVRLVLVGSGEAESGLKKMAAEFGIEDSVVFTGRIKYDELADHLRLADVAINPFRLTPVADHALPGKVLQYVGCAIPTVSTPLEGLKGLFPEGSGVVYRTPGAPFVEAVEQLLSDRDLAAHIGKQGRATIESTCQWDESIASFEATIREAIEGA